MRTRHILIIIAVLALAVPAPAVHAGGVVTVCDEAHLLAALAGGGTVTFACSGVITLTAEIVIAADTTIDGSGRAVTISGNHAVRVLTVNTGIMLNLNGITVAHGSVLVGGGIVNNGMLTVNHSTVSGNSGGEDYGAGGIQNNGTLIVNNSAWILTVSNSTFFGNKASLTGGGIQAFGWLTASNSTFFGNSASLTGGGIAASGNVTVINSTFSDNSADSGGGIHSQGTLAVSSSAFPGNSATWDGGAYGYDGNMTMLKNTIVANSPAGGNCFGAIIDGGGNLSYPDTTCPGINLNPLIYPLQDNGGPTWTMALGPGSAASDAGDDATCAADPVNNLDQRGVVRPQGAHCDIGALEQLRVWLPITLTQ